jgi:hypothetical protein
VPRTFRLKMSRAIGSLHFLSAPTFHCRTAGPGGFRSCRSFTLSDVPGKMTVDVFAGRRSPYLQSGFFAESPNHRRSTVSQELPSTQIRWRLRNSCRHRISSRNHVFCHCPTFATSACWKWCPSFVILLVVLLLQVRHWRAAVIIRLLIYALAVF